MKQVDQIDALRTKRPCVPTTRIESAVRKNSDACMSGIVRKRTVRKRAQDRTQFLFSGTPSLSIPQVGYLSN